MRELKQKKILYNLELDDYESTPEVEYMRELVRRAGHAWQLNMVYMYLKERSEDNANDQQSYSNKQHRSASQLYSTGSSISNVHDVEESAEDVPDTDELI